MVFPINPNIPAASDDPADDQPLMQANFANINSYLQVDHTNPSNTGAGQHKQVTFNGNNVPGGPPVNPQSILYTNNDAFSNPELFFLNSSNGSQNNVNTKGSIALFGGIVLKWGTINFTGSSKVVSFATDSSSFLHNLLAVSCISVSTTPSVNGIISISSQTNTGFTAFQNGGGALTAYYIAIGN